jgi:hypothetical protein
MCGDKQVEIARQKDITYPDADIFPAKKWAIFATLPDYYKITGKTTTLLYAPLQKKMKRNVAKPQENNRILIQTTCIFISNSLNPMPKQVLL